MTFEAGTTCMTVPFMSVIDDINEEDEVFTAVLNPDSGVSQGNVFIATVTIGDLNRK